jgi:hypothetical protein
MSNIFLIGLVRMFLGSHLEGVNEVHLYDTVFYKGLIAIEMVNTSYGNHKRVDLIDKSNVTNCLGFVLFADKISEKNFEQSFFPLSLCDKNVASNDVLNSNNKFYDTIFNAIRTNSLDYHKNIKIKGVGKVRLNYKIINVRLKYVVIRQSSLKKYVRSSDGSDEDIQIKSNVCEIISLIIEQNSY